MQVNQTISQQMIHLQFNEEITLLQTFSFLIKLIIVIGIFYVLVLKRKKRDLNKLSIKQSITVPKQKIIVALEIVDFFVNISNKNQKGYQSLQTINQPQNFILRFMSQFLGRKTYFKPIFSSRDIISFVKGLKQIKSVQLMIYTGLNPQKCDLILQKLKLQVFFPIERRKFCKLEHEDMNKHAIEVDKDSRRVVIITPSKLDHNWFDEKYFIVLNPKKGGKHDFLKNNLRILKNLFQKNIQRDVLHDQLAQLKIDICESDLQNDTQKQIS